MSDLRSETRWPSYDDSEAYEPSPHRTSYKSPAWVDNLTDRAEEER